MFTKEKIDFIKETWIKRIYKDILPPFAAENVKIENLLNINVELKSANWFQDNYEYPYVYGLFDYTEEPCTVYLNSYYIINWGTLHETIVHELIHALNYFSCQVQGIDYSKIDQHGTFFEHIKEQILIIYGLDV